MILSPVLHFELVGIGRRARYFLSRGVYGLALFIALWIVYVDCFPRGATNLSSYAQFARTFFITFSILQLSAILIITPAMTAGTIAGEHERRTIDYLLTTHLTDAEITFSKFASRLAAIIYQAVVGLPILLLVMLLGGIDPGAVAKVFAVTLLVLVGTASLSLWISASSRHSRSAVTSAYLVVIALLLIPWLVWLILMEWNARSTWLFDVSEAIFAFHPFALVIAQFQPFAPTVNAWQTAAWVGGIYLGLSTLWLGLAVWMMRRTYLRAPAAGVTKRRWLPAWTQTRRAVRDRAMLWKEIVCERSALRLDWIGKIAGGLLFLTAYGCLTMAVWSTIKQEQSAAQNATSPYSSSGWYKTDPFGYAVPFLDTALHHCSTIANAIVGPFILLLITARAAGSVTVEKEQESWLTLMSTPLVGREIVVAKMLGAVYSVRYWYLFLAACWLCCTIRYPWQAYYLPVMIIPHVVLAWLCAATGMFFSLRCKSSIWAIGSALAVVAVALGGLPLALTFLADAGGSGQAEEYFFGFFSPITFAAPEIILVRKYFYGSSNDERVGASTMVACVSWLIVSGILTGYLIRSFNSLSGRIDRTFGRRGVT